MSWDIPTATVYEFKRAKKVKIGVWAIQRGLNSIGFAIAEDGVFGKQTKQAVEDAQGSWGLSAIDGVFGPKSSNALAESLGANVGVDTLPQHLLKGIVEGESGGLISAVNWTVAGGVDCGYCQRRVYASDYDDDDTIERAFDGKYQMNLLKNVLIGRYDVFITRNDNTREKAWRLATLHHNYPYAADKISQVGIEGLSTYFRNPQPWVQNIGAFFPDGTPVFTPLEWCQYYALGSEEHNHPGAMTKYVEDWNV